MSHETAQEEFWRGSFGTEYASRNDSQELVAANLALFSRALSAAGRPSTILELGANVGMNLVALSQLFPSAALHAVEINAAACDRLRTFLAPDSVTEGSILDPFPPAAFDLVLVKGVLIHIAPDDLHIAYRRAVDSTARYLLICEYYNPTPVEVPYRGSRDRLFKRDFCGEILDLYPELRLRDYGFVYRRDPSFPLDDITWFLLERRET